MALFGLISGRLTVALVVVGFVVFVYVHRYLVSRRINRLGKRAPIYPTKLPFGFEIPYVAVKAANQYKSYEFWYSLFEITGAAKLKSWTVEWTMMEIRLLFTADPENIKAILTTQFTDFGKGAQFHKEWEQFLGNSIFVTDGKMWHDSRQLIRPMFMRERVADLNVLEGHVSKLIKLMGSGEGSMVRVDKLLSRFTLDAVTHYLFGKSAGSLDDEGAIFGSAFDEVQRMQIMRMRLGPFRYFLDQRSFRAGLRTMDQFIEPLITSVLKMSPSELEEKTTKSDTFIHALARFTRDRKVIRDQLVSLLLAGRDTTAATLSWIFLELARNPHVVQKLRAEISEHVGNNSAMPTYENIKDMKYLTYIINETLRLYPPVPYNIRASLKDTTIPRGGGPNGQDPIGIPKGTAVAYATIMMQRDRDLYPPISESFPYDPLEWVPDRWFTWQPKAWNFIPFNGGPRICIGQQFAMIEMGYTLIRVFQQFDKIVDFGNKPILKTEILLTPAEGVKVGFVSGAQNVEKSH